MTEDFLENLGFTLQSERAIARLIAATALLTGACKGIASRSDIPEDLKESLLKIAAIGEQALRPKRSDRSE